VALEDRVWGILVYNEILT